MNPGAQPFLIRPMIAADVERIIEIAEGLRQAPHWPREAYMAALDEHAVPRRIALVAEHTASARVAGFAVVSLTPPESELETIAVSVEFRRRGLARQLLEALAEAIRREGVCMTLLEVRASNEEAQAFYRAMGFVEAGRRPGYYADPLEDAVLMRLAFVQFCPKP